jgi:hypothetical protein
MEKHVVELGVLVIIKSVEVLEVESGQRQL